MASATLTSMAFERTRALHISCASRSAKLLRAVALPRRRSNSQVAKVLADLQDRDTSPANALGHPHSVRCRHCHRKNVWPRRPAPPFDRFTRARRIRHSHARVIRPQPTDLWPGLSDTGFSPGEDGPNQYGPNPLTSQ